MSVRLKTLWVIVLDELRDALLTNTCYVQLRQTKGRWTFTHRWPGWPHPRWHESDHLCRRTGRPNRHPIRQGTLSPHWCTFYLLPHPNHVSATSVLTDCIGDFFHVRRTWNRSVLLLYPHARTTSMSFRGHSPSGSSHSLHPSHSRPSQMPRTSSIQTALSRKHTRPRSTCVRLIPHPHISRLGPQTGWSRSGTSTKVISHTSSRVTGVWLAR